MNTHEVTFLMASFFAGIKIFRFWPKTMDYRKAFRSIYLCTHNSSLEGATKLKFAIPAGGGGGGGGGVPVQ